MPKIINMMVFKDYPFDFQYINDYCLNADYGI